MADIVTGQDVDIISSVLPTGAATEVSVAAAATSLAIMDDWDESDRAKVNVIVGQAGITAGAGSVAANTPRITHASDSPITTSIQLLDDTVTVLGTDTYTEAISKAINVSAVRRDADTTLVNTTNEFGPLQMDANGRLKVEAFSGETLPVSLTSTTITGTVTTQDTSTLVDDAAFTPATSRVTMFGAEFDNSGIDSVDENDGGALRMSQNRNLYVNIRDTAGNERGANVDTNSNLQVVLPAETTKVIGTVRNLGNVGGVFDGVIGAATAPANMLLTGAVFNTTAPAPTTGQSMVAQSDQAGNLLTFPSVAVAALSVWNSSTALNTTQNIFTKSGAPAAMVQIVQSAGTFSAGAITFEVSYDNSTWNTLPVNQIMEPLSTTMVPVTLPHTLVTATTKQFLILCRGAQGLRMKLSTAITGTGTVTPNYTLLSNSPGLDSCIKANNSTAAGRYLAVGGYSADDNAVFVLPLTNSGQEVKVSGTLVDSISDPALVVGGYSRDDQLNYTVPLTSGGDAVMVDVRSFSGGNVPISGSALAYSTRNQTFTTASSGSLIAAYAKTVSLQVVPTGAVTSWTVVLEASLDAGTTYATVLTHTNVAPGSGLIIVSGTAANPDTPSATWRLRCSAIVLGAGTNIKAYCTLAY